jgi:hypothetical protein
MPGKHEDWRSRHAEPLALAAVKEQRIIERETTLSFRMDR